MAVEEEIPSLRLLSGFALGHGSRWAGYWGSDQAGVGVCCCSWLMRVWPGLAAPSRVQPGRLYLEAPGVCDQTPRVCGDVVCGGSRKWNLTMSLQERGQRKKNPKTCRHLATVPVMIMIIQTRFFLVYQGTLTCRLTQQLPSPQVPNCVS